MTKKARRQLSVTKTRRQVDTRRERTEQHLGMTIADWRLKKRQQWRVVVHALDLFSFGAAYTPVGVDLYEIQKAAERIAEAMAEDWVCW